MHDNEIDYTFYFVLAGFTVNKWHLVTASRTP